MTLSIVLTIMTSVATVLVVAPFLRRLDQQQEMPARGDLERYCDQFAEIAKRAAGGLIDGEHAERACAEIKGALLAADRAVAPRRFSFGALNLAPFAIAGILLCGSVTLYALGGPDLPSVEKGAQGGVSAVDQLAAATQDSDGLQQTPAPAHLGPVDEMIGKLVERLDRSPNDPEGWRMLGWSYFNTERFAQAGDAYAKAMALDPSKADFRSARGEALVRAANGQVTDEARQMFGEALRLDAKDPRARFFIGVAKEQAGDKSAALDDFIALLNESGPKDAWVGDLKQRIADLSRETGIDVADRLHLPPVAPAGGLLATLEQKEQESVGPADVAPANKVVPSNVGPSNVGPSNAGPSAEDVRAAETKPPAERMAMIQGMVERLASRLSASPRDVDGWIRLMRSRQVLGEADAATQALHSALDVFKDAPQEQARISTAARELGLIK